MFGPLAEAGDLVVALVDSLPAASANLSPFAAAAMERFGLRRILIGALVLMSASSAVSAYMTEPWHLLMTWGVFSGISSGAVASVLGATIVNRWFTKHRGLVMGLLTASTASGTLVFLPVLATLASSGDWTRVVWTLSLIHI